MKFVVKKIAQAQKRRPKVMNFCEVSFCGRVYEFFLVQYINFLVFNYEILRRFTYFCRYKSTYYTPIFMGTLALSFEFKSLQKKKLTEAV